MGRSKGHPHVKRHSVEKFECEHCGAGIEFSHDIDGAKRDEYFRQFTERHRDCVNGRRVINMRTVDGVRTQLILHDKPEAPEGVGGA